MDTDKPRRTPSGATPATWVKAGRIAAELDVSVRTVKRWIADGKVDAIRLTPQGEWRINRPSLDAWLETLRSRCSPRDDDGDDAVAGS
jgi:excisionase family DNA binding protein